LEEDIENSKIQEDEARAEENLLKTIQKKRARIAQVGLFLSILKLFLASNPD
jgi:hypothetical protein